MAIASLPTIPDGWDILNSGDFNGDGFSDLLLRNEQTGTVAIDELNANHALISTVTVANPGTSWMPVAVGNLNGTGPDDIIMQNANGDVQAWFMGHGQITGTADIDNPGPNWHVVEAGQFGKDTQTDIILQNTDGLVALWDMGRQNGQLIEHSTIVGTPGPAGVEAVNPGLNWKVVGEGDFNGDGDEDLVFQNNQNGNVAVWNLDGEGHIEASKTVGEPGTSWKVIGTGDFNHDIFTDIALKNTKTGAVVEWDMTGSPGGSSIEHVVTTPIMGTDLTHVLSDSSIVTFHKS